jgi:hypothetical protein
MDFSRVLFTIITIHRSLLSCFSLSKLLRCFPRDLLIPINNRDPGTLAEPTCHVTAIESEGHQCLRRGIYWKRYCGAYGPCASRHNYIGSRVIGGFSRNPKRVAVR